MKTRILLCMMALWAICAAAQPRVADNGLCQMPSQHPVVSKAPTAQDPTIILNNLKGGLISNNLPYTVGLNGKFDPNSCNQKTKVAENGVNVTVKWIYDHEAFRGFLNDVLILNEDFRIIGFNDSWDEETFEPTDSKTVVVPMGCYDVIARFFDRNDKPYLIIKEDINIEDDTTLTIDVAEATNNISVVATNPQGETFILPVYQNDDLITEGNTHVQSCNRTLISKKYGYIHSTIFHTDHTVVDGPLGGDICVNNVSDNYSMIEELISFVGNHDLFFNYFCVNDLNASCTITDDANVYAHAEERFVPGLFENESGIAGNAFMGATSCSFMNNFNVLGFGYAGWGQGYEINGGVNCHIDKDDSFQIGDNTFNLVAISDIYYIDWGEEMEFEQIGAPIRFNGSELEYMVGTMSGNYRYDSELKEPVLSHPKFSCIQSQKQSDYGFGVPTLSTEIGQMYADDISPFIQCRYYGRLGEMSLSDFMTPTASGKLNGEEICNSVWDLSTFAEQIFNESTNSGEVEISLNLTNRIFEDNIEGSNLTVVKFDLSREDRTPPTLQLLQFRDINDNVTEIFSDFSQATFRFCGGDFVENAVDDGWGGYGYWFDCKPVTAVVEYTPNGSDDWQEVACEQKPEYYMLPFYGHYFEGTIPEANSYSNNGWYDMRITLTDESGNSQTQTISPAFRIDHAQSSVATLRDGNAHEVARYNLAGQRVDANATGVVIIKMSDGTARKVIL